MMKRMLYYRKYRNLTVDVHDKNLERNIREGWCVAKSRNNKSFIDKIQ